MYNRFADEEEGLDGFRSAGPNGQRGSAQSTTTSTTTQATTTKKLSANYKHRPDGRIIDYNSDPNYPYVLNATMYYYSIIILTN